MKAIKEIINKGNLVGYQFTDRNRVGTIEFGESGFLFSHPYRVEGGAFEIVNVDTSNLNSYVDITFSQGVYGAITADYRVTLDDWDFTFTRGTGTALNIELLSISRTDGENLSGGESTIRFALYVEGLANGDETIEITAKTDSIYNISEEPLVGGTGVLSIQEESNIDPISRTKDVHLYLDATDTNTINEDNDFIFTDKTLNELPALQSVAEDKPSYDSTKVTFSSNTFLETEKPIFLNQDGFSLFFVIQRANGGDHRVVTSTTYEGLTLDGNLAYLLIRGSTVLLSTQGSSTITFTATLGTSKQLVEIRFDGINQWQLLQNGAIVDTVTNTNSPLAFNRIGHAGPTQSFVGDLYSICLYNGTDVDVRGMLETHLTDKYISETETSVIDKTILPIKADGLILNGQSNAAGRTDVDNLDSSYVSLLSTNGGTILDGNMTENMIEEYVIRNQYSGELSGDQFGVEARILESMQEVKDNNFFIKYSVGGTGLDPTSSPTYWTKADTTTNRFKLSGLIELSALQKLRGNLYNPNVLGVIWLQGETDAESATPAANYQSNFTQFKTDLRAFLKLPNLKFLSYDVISGTEQSTVNSGFAASALTDLNHTHRTETQGKSTIDGVHYTADAMVEISDDAYTNWVSLL